jgi:hypothetical protein
MNESEKIEPNLNPSKPPYTQAYQKIKSRCQFQKNFSFFLLVVFFTLQYSVPIFLVVLGSIASSREQLALFFSPEPVSRQTDTTTTASEAKTSSASEAVVSRIIYLVGLITILLGVINNIVRPAESYDTAARYNNKFYRFEQNFDLGLLAISSFSDKLNNKDTDKIIISFLIAKNEELCQLIEEYNDARSLSPRQTHLQALNQDKNKDNLETVDNISSVKPDDKVSSSNPSTSFSTETESELESQQ